MTCQEFWDRMPELAGQLLRDESDHLESCPQCTGAWARQRALQGGIVRLSAELRKMEAPSRVEAGLVAAYRAQSHRRKAPATSWGWTPLVAGIAAALLMAASLFLLRERPPAPQQHRSGSMVQLASLPAPSGEELEDQTPDSEGFIPLPNAESIAPDENVNVVRVEVPRSAMLAVGLTVPPDLTSDLVEADIKMGANGLARAVRFVDE